MKLLAGRHSGKWYLQILVYYIFLVSKIGFFGSLRTYYTRMQNVPLCTWELLIVYKVGLKLIAGRHHLPTARVTMRAQFSNASVKEVSISNRTTGFLFLRKQRYLHYFYCFVVVSGLKISLNWSKLLPKRDSFLSNRLKNNNPRLFPFYLNWWFLSRTSFVRCWTWIHKRGLQRPRYYSIPGWPRPIQKVLNWL